MCTRILFLLSVCLLVSRVTVAGELREEQVRDMFMTSFSGTQERGEVSYAEFEEYYEGLSVGVSSDDDYINILKNAWGV